MSLFGYIQKKIQIGKKQAAKDTAKTEIRSEDPHRYETESDKTPLPPAFTKTAKWVKKDRILGRYEVHEIKEGGMGFVYLCYDHNYRLPVAIKTLKEHKDTGIKYEELLDKFYVEAEAWVRLEKHRNIVQAKGVERIEGKPYILLEFVTNHEYGANLHDLIRGKKQLDVIESLHFAIQFCAGMEHAAKRFQSMGKPFVHRDIKPANIMVTSDRVVKITDFGLVKIFDNTRDDIFSGAGTPPYMSPEQWQEREDIDIRSDIYSFGCVLYEMLTGVRPFVCVSNENYHHYHVHKQPVPVSNIIPSIPEDVNGLIMKCLEKDPDNRFRDFTALKSELSDIHYEMTGERFREVTAGEIEAWEYINKGIALCSLGYRQDAVLDFSKALEIDPMAAGRFIPDSLAKVREYSSPENRKDKLIFLIMSIFSNYSNQKSIAEILDVLVSRYGLKLISVEGGSGKIDLSFYSNIENAEKKKQTADYFLQHARIQGHEYFAITTGQDIAFYGAEDQELFEKNTDVFTAGLTDKDKWVGLCENVESGLSVLKKHIYNEELRTFEETITGLKDRDFERYIAFLQSLMDQFSIKGTYPNIALMIEAISLKKQGDIVEATKERDRLFAYLRQTLSDNEKEGFQKAIYELKEKIITQYQFYNYVHDMISKKFANDFLKSYPNFDLLLRHIMCFGKTDSLKLFEELRTIEDAIRAKLYTNNDQKTLDVYIKYTEILKKAYATKMAPAEEAYFKERRHEMSGRKIVDFIKDHAKKCGIIVVSSEAEKATVPPGRETIFLPEEAAGIGGNLAGSEQFYSAAQKRSIALIKNCLRQMEQEGESAGVLVTGGFHTQLITDYLKEQRIPYIVFVPESELSADDDQRYQNAVKGKKTPFEEEMERKKGRND